MAEPLDDEVSSSHTAAPAVSAVGTQSQNSLQRTPSNSKSSHHHHTMPLRQSFKDMKSRSLDDSKPIVASTSNTIPPCPLDEIDPSLWSSFARFSTIQEKDQLNLSYEQITETRFSSDEEDLLQSRQKQDSGANIRTESGKGVGRALSVSSNKIKTASNRLRKPSPTLPKKGLRGGADPQSENSQQVATSAKIDDTHTAKDPLSDSEGQPSVILPERKPAFLEPPPDHEEPAPEQIVGEPEAAPVPNSKQIAEMIRQDLREMRFEEDQDRGYRPKTAPSRMASHSHLPYDSIEPAWRVGRSTSEGFPQPSNNVSNDESVLHPRSEVSLSAYHRAFGMPNQRPSSIHTALSSQMGSRRSSYTFSNTASRPSTSYAVDKRSSSLSSRQPTILWDMPEARGLRLPPYEGMLAGNSTLFSRNLYKPGLGPQLNQSHSEAPNIPRARNSIDHRHYLPTHLPRSAYRSHSAPMITQKLHATAKQCNELVKKDIIASLVRDESGSDASDQSRQAQASSKDTFTRDVRIFEPADEYVRQSRKTRQERLADRFERLRSRVQRMFSSTASNIPELRRRKPRRFCLSIHEKLSVNIHGPPVQKTEVDHPSRDEVLGREIVVYRGNS